MVVVEGAGKRSEVSLSVMAIGMKPKLRQVKPLGYRAIHPPWPLSNCNFSHSQ